MSNPDDNSLRGRSVLFIVNNFKNLTGTITFLERRGILVFHAQNLKEAVDIISGQEINFAILSVDLNNAPPAKVIPILTVNFKTETLAFAEKADRASRIHLTSLLHPNKLFGPLSGPKIIATMVQLTAGGALSDKDGNRVVVNFSGETNDDIIIQKGDRGKLHSTTQSLSKYSREIDISGKQFKAPTGRRSSPQSAPQTKIELEKPAAKTGGTIEIPTGESKPKSTSIAEEKLKAKTNGSGSSLPKKDDVQDSPIDQVQNSKKNLYANTSSMGAGVAVNPFLIPSHGSKLVASPTKRICALTIKSNKFKGYLVIAMNEGEAVPIALVHKIRQTLANYLKRQGEEVDPENYGFEIDLDNLEFSNWAAEYADFISLDEQGEGEIAMAFVSGEDALPVMEASAVPELCAVARKDIRPDTRLDFDLYLHLPANGKFIRYGSKGGVLSQRQLDRLKGGDIIYFHILQKQKKSFQAYCGRHYIRARLSNSQDVVSLSRVFKKVAG